MTRAPEAWWRVPGTWWCEPVRAPSPHGAFSQKGQGEAGQTFGHGNKSHLGMINSKCWWNGDGEKGSQGESHKKPLRTSLYMLHIVSGTHTILGQLRILFGWCKHIYIYTHIYNDCSIDIKYIPSSLWSYSHIPHHSGSTGDLRCSLLLSQISSKQPELLLRIALASDWRVRPPTLEDRRR